MAFSRQAMVRVPDLTYTTLETRRLLVVNFAWEGPAEAIVITGQLKENRQAQEIQISDSGDYYEFRIVAGDTFEGTNQGSDLFTNDARDSLFVAKELFENHPNTSLRVDFQKTESTGLAFSGPVDFTPVFGGLQFLTSGTIRQTAPIITGDLELAGVSIHLDQEGNEFGKVEISQEGPVKTEVVVLQEAGTAFIGDMMASAVIILQADVLELRGAIRSGQALIMKTTSSIEQNLSSQIETPRLLLMSEGDVSLPSSHNTIEKLAGHIVGDFQLTVDGLLTFDHIDSTVGSWSGLEVLGDMELLAVAGGSIWQSERGPLICLGESTLDVRSGDIGLSGADRDQDGQNDNQLNRVKLYGQQIELVDSNNLHVAGMIATERGWLAAGSSGAGRLTLAGNIQATYTLLLQAGSGIVQESGILETYALLVGGDEPQESSGNVRLTSISNHFEQLAVRLNAGSAWLWSSSSVIVANAQFDRLASSPIEEVSGIQLPGHLDLRAASLQDAAGVNLTIGRDLILEVVEGIWLADDEDNVVNVGRYGNLTAGASIGLGNSGQVQLRAVSASAAEFLQIETDADLVLRDVTSAKAMTLKCLGTMTMLSGATLTATEPSFFEAGQAIRLADHVSHMVALGDATLIAPGCIQIGGFDNARIKRTRFESEGDVRIFQEGYLTLMGTNKAHTMLLHSSQVIRDSNTATLEVAGQATFHATRGVSLADGVENRYELQGPIQFDVGEFVLVHQPGQVRMGPYTVTDGVFASLSIDEVI